MEEHFGVTTLFSNILKESADAARTRSCWRRAGDMRIYIMRLVSWSSSGEYKNMLYSLKTEQLKRSKL